MKIVQILGGFVHWDASASVPSLEAASRLFAADMIFVEAPDYVFEGWGFDPMQDGDARFVKPEPPEGCMTMQRVHFIQKTNRRQGSLIRTLRCGMILRRHMRKG